MKLKLMDHKWKNIVSYNYNCSLETESRPLKLLDHVVWSVVLRIILKRYLVSTVGLKLLSRRANDLLQGF